MIDPDQVIQRDEIELVLKQRPDGSYDVDVMYEGHVLIQCEQVPGPVDHARRQVNAMVDQLFVYANEIRRRKSLN